MAEKGGYGLPNGCSTRKEPWHQRGVRALIADPGIDQAVSNTAVSPKMNKPSYNEVDCIEALTAFAAECISTYATQDRI
jgi:hypothetical protein